MDLGLKQHQIVLTRLQGSTPKKCFGYHHLDNLKKEAQK